MEGLVLIPGLEWRPAGQELVDDATKGPQVACLASILVCQQLWTDIFSRSHKGAGPFLLGHVVRVEYWYRARTLVRPPLGLENFGGSKVGDFDIHLGIKQNVFRFEITMDYTALVHVVDSVQNLGAVEPCTLLVKSGHPLQHSQQFAAFAEIEDEIERSFVLECIVKSDDTRMVGESIQGVLLDIHVFDLLFFDDVAFVQDFDSILFQGLAICRQNNGTVRALSEGMPKREITDPLFDITSNWFPVGVNLLSHRDCGTTVLPFLTAWTRAIFHPIRRTGHLRGGTRTARLGSRRLTHHHGLRGSIRSVTMTVITGRHTSLQGSRTTARFDTCLTFRRGRCGGVGTDTI